MGGGRDACCVSKTNRVRRAGRARDGGYADTYFCETGVQKFHADAGRPFWFLPRPSVRCCRVVALHMPSTDHMVPLVPDGLSFRRRHATPQGCVQWPEAGGE